MTDTECIEEVTKEKIINQEYSKEGERKKNNIIIIYKMPKHTPAKRLKNLLKKLLMRKRMMRKKRRLPPRTKSGRFRKRRKRK